MKSWYFKYAFKKIVSIPPIGAVSKWILRKLWVLRVFIRTHWTRQSPLESDTALDFPGSIHILIINLKSRQDRWEQVRGEMLRMGIGRFTRFEAIKKPRGSLGCALSHLTALANFDENIDLILICEDDVEFICSPELIEKVVKAFVRNDSLDVLCLGNHTRNPLPIVHSTLAVSNDIGTTSCYLVKRRARQVLLKSFRKSARLLEIGYPDSLAAVDQEWKSTQQCKLVFEVSIVRLVK